jgi:hypothetical protein
VRVVRRPQPSFASGPAPVRVAPSPAALADTRGPRVIPYLKPSPTQTPPAPPPSPPRARLPSVARTPRSTPTPLQAATAPLGPSPENLAATELLCAAARNPSAVAAFNPPRRRLSVVGEQSRSFAGTCGSRRCCWFVLPTHTSLGRCRRKSAAADRHFKP